MDLYEHVFELIEAEKAEQLTWVTSVPAWHPRNETQEEVPPVDEETEDDDDEDDEDKGLSTDQLETKKAYAKLREAEARERKTQAELNKLKNAGLNEKDRAEAERDAARAETAELQASLARIELEKDVSRIAKGLKFRNAEKAMRFVDPGSTDEKSIRGDLKAALADYPELASDGSPPPPVNDRNGKPTGNSNNRMNDAIRSAAGRG